MKLIAKSRLFAEVLAQAEAFAPRSSSVLLLGRTGTGKSELARTIHAASPRARGPLIEVNCAALPNTLIERELFGTTAGAYTGALGAATGKIAAADHGTLFLDEIGELDPVAQAKLLDVIQSKRVTPLGATRPINVDVRFISATNQNLRALMRTRRFREDLYYRLCVLVLRVPALAKRPSDILPLADHFLSLSCEREELPPVEFSQEARIALLVAPWRGNVRELAHTIERALVSCAAEGAAEIEPRHLFRSKRARTQLDFRSATRMFQQAFIEDTLRRNRGCVDRVARTIGIARSRLYKLLEELQIDPADFRRRK